MNFFIKLTAFTAGCLLASVIYAHPSYSPMVDVSPLDNDSSPLPKGAKIVASTHPDEFFILAEHENQKPAPMDVSNAPVGKKTVPMIKTALAKTMPQQKMAAATLRPANHEAAKHVPERVANKKSALKTKLAAKSTHHATRSHLS